MPLKRTAQEILDSANTELGLPLSQIGYLSNSQASKQALALMNGLVYDLARLHDWQFLMSVAHLVGDGVSDHFDLPPDYFRFVDQTMWNSSNMRRMYGPDLPQTWGWLKYGILGAGINYRYRVDNNKLEIYPVPAAGVTFDFYYINNKWVLNANQQYVQSITAASDTPVYDSRLVITGTKVRLWAQKGLDTTNLVEEFNFALDSEKGIAQGAAAISLVGGCTEPLISIYNLPESGYGE